MSKPCRAGCVFRAGAGLSATLPDGTAVVRRVIDADNSCLFNAVGYVMQGSRSRAPALRSVPPSCTTLQFVETEQWPTPSHNPYKRAMLQSLWTAYNLDSLQFCGCSYQMPLLLKDSGDSFEHQHVAPELSPDSTVDPSAGRSLLRLWPATRKRTRRASSANRTRSTAPGLRTASGGAAASSCPSSPSAPQMVDERGAVSKRPAGFWMHALSSETTKTLSDSQTQTLRAGDRGV